jgi:hypothetical protein
MHRELAHLRQTTSEVDEIIQLHSAMLGRNGASPLNIALEHDLRRDNDPPASLEFHCHLFGWDRPQHLLRGDGDLCVGTKWQFITGFDGSQPGDELIGLFLAEASRGLALVQTERMARFSKVAESSAAHMLQKLIDKSCISGSSRLLSKCHRISLTHRCDNFTHPR